jgi:hypothetical protein
MHPAGHRPTEGTSSTILSETERISSDSIIGTGLTWIL